MAAHRTTRDGTVGPSTRPVSVPDDLNDPSIDKAAGPVVLPVSLRWSHPRRTYDLTDPADRALVYEQVLTEGTDDDVRRYIEADEILRLWDVLVPACPRARSLGVVVVGSSRRTPTLLTELQERVARIVAGLPEGNGFALAGGAAVIIHGSSTGAPTIWTSSAPPSRTSIASRTPR